jgi:hypothetical protein
MAMHLPRLLMIRGAMSSHGDQSSDTIAISVDDDMTAIQQERI